MAETSGSLKQEETIARCQESIFPRWVAVRQQQQQQQQQPGVTATDDVSSKNSRRATIVSFNMLAQGAIRRSIFSYCSKRALKWNYRRANLLRELRLLAGVEGDAGGRPADIICLQEVDDQFYRSFWEPAMKEAGFRGEMLPKGYPDHAQAAHGCAVFWRDALFECAEYERVDFRDCGEGTEGVEHDELARRGVAQLLLLRWREGSTPACRGVAISNTHLYWNPRYEYVRLKQAFLVMERLFALLRRTSDHYAPFLVGDHNATPDTFCYDLLTNRVTLDDDPRWQRLLLPAEHFEAGANDLKAVVAESNDGTLVNKTLKREIASVADRKRIEDAKALVAHARESLPILVNPYNGYSTLTGQWTNEPSGVPPHTTVGQAWSGPLDYVFIPGDTEVAGTESVPVHVEALLRVDDAEVLKVQEGLPNDWRGSDHVPVGVSFSC